MSRVNKFILIIILGIVFKGVIAKHKLSQTAPQGFWPISVGQYSQSGNKIMAYHDFNKDRNVDIVSISTISSQQYIYLYLWRTTYQKFTIATSLGTIFQSIQAILPADYDNNGKDDIAVVFNLGIDQDGSVHYGLQILTIQCLSTSLCNFIQGPKVSTQFITFDQIQPFVMTINNQPVIIISKLHILYALKWQDGQLVGQPFIQNYVYKLAQGEQNIDNLPQYNGGILKGSFWGDYDGDCWLDLILSVQRDDRNYIQFFNGYIESNSKFKFVRQVRTEYIIHHFSLNDINFDGRVDLILLFAQNAGLQIHYHKYGKQTILCSSVPFPYDLELPQQSTSYSRIQRIPLKQQQKSFKKSMIRFGDFDNDGYPDLTLSLKVNQNIQSFLYQNIQCVKTQCGTYNPVFIQKSTTMNIRTFSQFNFIPANINQTKFQNIQSLSFFDIYEDGQIDLIANTYTIPSTASQKSVFAIEGIFNNLRIDAFFMKILILDGRSKVIAENGVIVGGTIQIFVTLLSGSQQPSVANQLSQLSGRVLQLPYGHIGLGRTNNYIQKLTVSIPYNNTQLSKQWSPIVPNSQVIIIPPIADTKWIITTYIEATDKLVKVFWLVLLVLIILGAAILNQTRKEKIQDKENMESFYSILR